jgi:putative protease
MRSYPINNPYILILSSSIALLFPGISPIVVAVAQRVPWRGLINWQPYNYDRSTLRRLPELLAPAGSPEALHSAIAAGADAVYLGGKRFGARKFADNFDDSALAEAIDYAHLRGVRVYVTVNTLIREDELSDAALYLIRLYEMGADAVLLQDLGVAALAGQLVPELERHASTQMTIHNREDVLFAARAGFKRAVLAREVTLDEIKKWESETKSTGLGLEVFVHGALCYCYSGQCLLSSAIGGRSGNRGMCAQPCRKPYVLLRGKTDGYGRPVGLAAESQKERFLISMRDLSVYRHLDWIVRSPVQSLKIEGRMKSPEYVAIVTSIYRRALDSIARGSWKASDEDERDLALAFNRDFTEGHLLGARDFMGRKASDNQGLLLGSVASYDLQRGEAVVRLCGPLAPEKGDGLVFQAPGQEMGLVVQSAFQNSGQVRLKTPERVRPGARVYLTGSTSLARRAQEISISGKAEIPIDLAISFADGTCSIEAKLPAGQSVEVKAGFKMEKAKNQPLTRQQIESQMRRTGGTPFVIRKIDMDYPGDLFAPLGALNQLRRDLLDEVEKALLKRHRPGGESVARARERLQEMRLLGRPDVGGREGRIPTLAVYADSLETVQGAVEGGCRRIYFEPLLGETRDRLGETRKRLAQARVICQKADAELIWKWPRITRDDFFEFARPLLNDVDADGIMVENIGAVEAVLAANSKARIYGASGLNVWNHLTIQALAPYIQHLTLSAELSRDQLARTVAAAGDVGGCHPKLELMVQGNLEVMVTEDCIPCLAKGKPNPGDFWGLQDFKRVFPVRLDDGGRTHIFNSAETCLLDLMPEVFRIGLDGIAVDARGRTGEYAREMTEIYIKAIELTRTGSAPAEELMLLKEQIRPLALGGITYGHFIKGLKEELS